MEDSGMRFLNGNARRPYVLREDIARGLRQIGIIPNLNNKEERVISSTCTCQETLGRFADTFNRMLHTDRALICSDSIHQAKSPKKYRNITKQNEWLLQNVFDVYGNYTFCVSCIIKILNVHPTRLHRLREIKRGLAKAPIKQIRKKDVSKAVVGNIVPPSNVVNILEWWINLDDDNLVELRDIPKLHCGSSNNSKEILLPRFLKFIDTNSQPNGRQISSHGPLFFISPKFARINAPSRNEANKPEQWKRRSVVYEFNRTLNDGESICNGTAKKWLKMYRPKHAISPLRTDYCQMCAECQEQKRRAEAICNRLQQNGNGDEHRIRECQTLAESYGLLLEEHRMEANRELCHYREQTSESRSSYLHIQQIQEKKRRTGEDERQLQKLMDEITFTLSLDYQQSKLIPHWGNTSQPGETYYLRKLSHNIFGIIDHALAENTVYVLDERACGTKNADLTISLVDHYIHQKIPPWVRHLCLYMDNGPTNKNQYMVQYGMELVQHHKYNTVRMCFLVAGHAKFDPDRLFSRIANTFNVSDVFVTEQLLALIQNIINPTGSCIHITNRDVVDWKSLLVNKYKPLEDIKNFREFLIKHDENGKVAVFQRACCYEGNYIHTMLLKKGVDDCLDLRKKLHKFTYDAKGVCSELSKEKVEDLCKMFDSCIDSDLRPQWLPAPRSINIKPSAPSETPSALLARQHRKELKAQKKKRGE
jgi:hypothetical protein